MKRNKKLEKYIKRMSGIAVEVRVVKKFWDLVGAKAWPEKQRITFAEDELDYKPLIWHEMGHLKTQITAYFSIKDEVSAQMWALRELRKRGYRKLYKESVDYVKEWGWNKECPKRYVYSRARNIILKKLGIK